MDLKELKEEFDKLSFNDKLKVVYPYHLSALYEIREILEMKYKVELDESQLVYIYDYLFKIDETLYDEYFLDDIAENLSEKLELKDE